MFNKVWGAFSLLILMVQTFGCYHLAGGCRARVPLGRGGKAQFFQAGLGRPAKEGDCGLGEVFWGGLEVRAAQERFAHRHRPFLLSVPQRRRGPQAPPERRPGPAARFLSLPPRGRPGAGLAGRGPTTPRARGPGGGVLGDPCLRPRAGPPLISGGCCENPALPKLISPRRGLAVRLIPPLLSGIPQFQREAP